MAQFDISKNNSRSSKDEIPYLMDIQSGSVSILGTRIVVPLRKATIFFDKTIRNYTKPQEIYFMINQIITKIE